MTGQKDKVDLVMVLTDEQKERMRINREKALEVKRQKTAERAAMATESTEALAVASKVCEDSKSDAGVDGDSQNEIELEEFEVGASQYVTKTEAMQVYCLPNGTLEVCEFIERENPRKKGWTSMKLFERADVRRRARKRHGGLEGLKEERKRRELKRLERDLESTKDVFKRRNV